MKFVHLYIISDVFPKGNLVCARGLLPCSPSVSLFCVPISRRRRRIQTEEAKGLALDAYIDFRECLPRLFDSSNGMNKIMPDLGNVYSPASKRAADRYQAVSIREISFLRIQRSNLFLCHCRISGDEPLLTAEPFSIFHCQ